MKAKLSILLLIGLAIVLCGFQHQTQVILTPAPVSGGGGTVAFLNANTPIQQVSTFSSAMSVTNSGSNRVAFVYVAIAQNLTNVVNTITYGGQTMTSCGVFEPAGTGGNSTLQVFYLVNPPTGSNTLAITSVSGAGSIEVNLIAFTGVNQTTPVRPGTYQGTNCIGASTCSPSTQIAQTITSDPNDLTFSATSGGTTGPNLNTSSQTSDGILNSGTDAFGSDHATTAASSVTHTWTYSNSTGDPAMIGFSIQHN